MINKRGPNIEPCGIPLKTDCHNEKIPLTFTLCFLEDKKASMQLVDAVSVDVRGNHCLSCRSGSSKFIRHSLINDIIWRAMTRAQIPSTKEPPGLLRSDGKKPDGVSLIPWSRTWTV